MHISARRSLIVALPAVLWGAQVHAYYGELQIGVRTSPFEKKARVPYGQYPVGYSSPHMISTSAMEASMAQLIQAARIPSWPIPVRGGGGGGRPLASAQNWAKGTYSNGTRFRSEVGGTTATTHWAKGYYSPASGGGRFRSGR